MSVPPIAPAPEIISVTPLRGAAGTTVVIRGMGFSEVASLNRITFNGKPANVISGDSQTLTVMVPLAAGDGEITVTAGNKVAVSTAKFSYVYTTSPFAGNGFLGLKDGVGENAQFSAAYGLTTDAAGNIYVADSNNNCIRKISPAGLVTTIAGDKIIGSTDGPVGQAKFNFPLGIVLDAAGNIYVADTGNNLIRKISVDNVVSTVAGSGHAGNANGLGKAAEFSSPAGITIDASGNLYVTDGRNARIRKISPTGMVSNFTNAVFSFPEGIVTDNTGNLYVADSGASIIRKVSATGVVTDFAGTGITGLADGPANIARFFNPEGLAIDAKGNLYVGDLGNNTVRKITQAGNVTTIAGNVSAGYAEGSGPEARFTAPSGVTVDTAGVVYITDSANARIRKIQ